jgi:hypothetical protein
MDSFNTLKGFGYNLQRIQKEEIKARYPKWNTKGQVYVDGYVNPTGGKYREIKAKVGSKVGLFWRS